MSVINHSLFGTIDSSGLQHPDICWQRQYSLGADEFEVCLWADQAALDLGTLDAFAEALQNLSALDVNARRELRAYLVKKPGSDYIEDHVEELADSPAVQAAMGANGEVDVDRFVAQMKIRNISLWHTSNHESSAPIVIDYMIDSQRSDQILAVKAMFNGDITVDWES